MSGARAMKLDEEKLTSVIGIRTTTRSADWVYECARKRYNGNVNEFMNDVLRVIMQIRAEDAVKLKAANGDTLGAILGLDQKGERP